MRRSVKPCDGRAQCGKGQAPSLRKMIYRNVNFVVGERSFAVPFGHVAEGFNAERVKPLPYERWCTVDVNFVVGERSCAVPFGHVMEGVNAEGVKPLPYERWLPCRFFG